MPWQDTEDQGLMGAAYRMKQKGQTEIKFIENKWIKHPSLQLMLKERELLHIL